MPPTCRTVHAWMDGRGMLAAWQAWALARIPPPPPLRVLGASLGVIRILHNSTPQPLLMTRCLNQMDSLPPALYLHARRTIDACPRSCSYCGGDHLP